MSQKLDKFLYAPDGRERFPYIVADPELTGNSYLMLYGWGRMDDNPTWDYELIPNVETFETMRFQSVPTRLRILRISHVAPSRPIVRARGIALLRKHLDRELTRMEHIASLVYRSRGRVLDGFAVCPDDGSIRYMLPKDAVSLASAPWILYPEPPNPPPFAAPVSKHKDAVYALVHVSSEVLRVVPATAAGESSVRFLFAERERMKAIEEQVIARHRALRMEVCKVPGLAERNREENYRWAVAELARRGIEWSES